MTALYRVALITLALLWAQTVNAAVLLDKSEIHFVCKQMGAPVEGRFKHFDADVVFKAADLVHSHAKITIDLASIDLASDESEAEVKGKNWFNVARFPQAVFQSTGIKALSGEHYEVRGHLTLKGVTQDIVVPLQIHTVSGVQIAEGSYPLMRTVFKIGEGTWADPDTVAEEIVVKFKMTLAP
jgi:polyisoprenoid-binding protein YceI